MRRAQMLAAGAGAAASIVVPRRARAATALNIALAAADSSMLLPAAQAYGFLDKSGLTVNIQWAMSGAASMAAVIGGTLDMAATNSLSMLQARDKGVPIKIVGAQAVYKAGSATTALVCGKDAPFRSGKDLAGKTVAVNSLGGSPHIAVKAWIDKTGGDANAVHYVELAFPAMPAAVASGRVDAAMIAEPALTTALQSGRLLADAYGAIGPLWLSDCIVASESWIDAHQDEARNLAQALHATAIWANKNHDKTAELATKLLKLDPETVRTMRRAIFAETVTTKLLQPVIDAGLTYGALTKSQPAEAAFDRYVLA